MNFHFNPSNPNRSSLLMKQLQQIDSDLETKKKQYQRRKLQNQFYQDEGNNKNMGLADEIMNQLLKGDNSGAKNNVPTKPNNIKNYQPQYPRPTQNSPYSNNNKYYQNLNNFNPIPNNNKTQNQITNNSPSHNTDKYSNSPAPYSKQANNNQFSNHYNNNGSNDQKNQVNYHNKQGEHENRFINRREMEKEKLQNEQGYPFGSKNAPVKRSIERDNISYENKPIPNEREMQKLKLQQQQENQNPFWREYNNRNRSYERINQQPEPQLYQNPRQLEKLKLQQKLMKNEGNFYSQGPQSPNNNQFPAQRDSYDNNISKKAAFQNRYSNPFTKDEDFIRQKKEQQQRELRRVLEEQKRIQEEKKKKQKQMVKEEKYAFNDYKPQKNNEGEAKKNQSPQAFPVKHSKKVDPNGKPPSYNYSSTDTYTSSADQEYMKMKASELKEKFKKGRIHYDEYMEQINKLAEFYKVSVNQLLDKKEQERNKDEQLPWINQGKNKQGERTDTGKSTDRYNNENNNKFQIIENQQSLQRLPQSETSLKNQNYNQAQFVRNQSRQPYGGYSGYNPYPNPYQFSNPNIYTQNLLNPPSGQYGLNSTAFQQFLHSDSELVRRMFQQMNSMRNDYTKSLQNQKKFLHQTLIKFMTQMQQQQLLNTQNSQQSSSQLNKNQTTQQKRQNKNASPHINKKYNNFISQGSQQNLTDQSMQYIEKSLSGIVNKIPLPKGHEPSFVVSSTNQKMNKKGKETETLEEFFSKPYKKKKFKKFSIMVDVSQSTMEIPNVSNFLALKNGKEVVNRLFEEDLLMMKKLQRQKEINKLRAKADEQYNYGDTFNKNHDILNSDNKNLNKRGTSEQNKANDTKFTRNQSSPQQEQYDQYQNYSRNRPSTKQRDIKSAQLNHRSYRKVDNSSYEQFPSNAFIKKNQKEQEQNFPNFNDQSDIKVRSPVYYSPKLNSEILEQDQYQTEQKGKEMLESEFYGADVGTSSKKKSKQPKSPQYNNASHKYEMKKKDYAYEQPRQSERKASSNSKSPSTKNNHTKPQLGIMNLIQSNNQALSKYQQHTPKNLNSYSPRYPQSQQVDIKQYSSINSNLPKQQEQLRNYFKDLDKEKNKDGERKSDLIESRNNRRSQRFNSQGYYAHSEQNIGNEVEEHNKQYQESLETVRSEEESVREHKRHDNSRKHDSEKATNNSAKHNNLKPPHHHTHHHPQSQANLHHQQDSIQYSQSYKPHSKRSPPSIAYSQTIQSIQQSSCRLNRPPLNKKKSTSKKKQSSIIRTKYQKESILIKPPSSNNDSQYNSVKSERVGKEGEGEKLKFDSQVYESEYDQTVDANMMNKKIQQMQRQEQKASRFGEGRQRSPQININPPVIITPKQHSNFTKQSQKISSSSMLGGGKLKSLQQARNLAKESKKKSGNIQHQNYQQKMSELQSFLTKRDDSFVKENSILGKQSLHPKIIKLGLQNNENTPKKSNNKNIMNLLDDLENQSVYRDDFQSYREESEYLKR